MKKLLVAVCLLVCLSGCWFVGTSECQGAHDWKEGAVAFRYCNGEDVPQLAGQPWMHAWICKECGLVSLVKP